MPITRFDQARDYGFADRALALREHAGLTQQALAALLGVSGRAVQAWEAGLSYPGAEHLTRLIALYVARGVFPAGREEEEAAALWETVRAHAPRRTVAFDHRWFASLRGGAVSAGRVAPHPLSAGGTAARRDDWGEAPDAGALYGRAQEVETLSRWLLADRCRLIALLGLGGIGKTLLAARLAHEVASQFSVVYWRSLRNALPVEEWLAGAIAALSAAQVLPPDGSAARLALLLELLQERRALLVLDNLETILEPGAPEARYREGYAGYGEVLQRMGQSVHDGCLLLTGREAPPELAPLARERGPVRTLRVGGLGWEAGRALLQERGLVGDDAAWEALVAHYSGNPLALSVVGETIDVVFGGDIAGFLAQETTIFGGIRGLLDGQVERLSTLERSIGIWLAVEREPVLFAELVADLGPGVAREELVEAVEALRRRSLLEQGIHGAFTLQPVVLEYVTERLVAALAEEILAGEPSRLARHALLKAVAKDYVRRSQERLIGGPLLERLRGSLGSTAAVEERLLGLLAEWRGRPAAEQGCGPGNAVNLLRLLRGDLRGLDLSRLTLRHAYLKGVEAQGAILAGAHLSEAVLAEAFHSLMALGLSSDGAYVAVGTSTGEVSLWRIADRTLLLAVQAHTGPVRCVALSGDGRLLASASQDGTIRLWETRPAAPPTAWPATDETKPPRGESPSPHSVGPPVLLRPPGRLLAILHGHTGVVWSLALSADGRLLASGGQDETVRLWETDGGQLLATLRGHSGAVSSVALSGDGQRVASGGQDGAVRLWETGGGRLLATLRGHTGNVWGVALSGDGRWGASGGADGAVRLWEADGGEPLAATLQTHSWGSVALSEDGRLVASSSWDGAVRLWETDGGRPLATLQGHTGTVWGVALSADGQLVASASYDGTVRLWEATPASGYAGRPLAILHGYSSEIWAVALSADGRLVASGSQDGTARLWDASSGRRVATLQGHSNAVWGVALSADGQLVASASYDGTVRLWNAATGHPLATLRGHSGPVQCVAISGDGRLVASGSFDGTAILWEAPSGRLLATLRGHSGLVYGVALSGDGRLVATGSYDGTVRLWEAPGGRLLATLQGCTDLVHGVAVSGDGRLVASGTSEGTVQLWEVASARLLATLQGHAGAVWGVALSGDGQLLASGSFDRTVRLWDVASGHALATFQGHDSVVQGVALSADGQVVASGSQDGTIRLWSVSSGEHLRTLRSDRPYERMDITGLTGVTEAQRAALLALGAVEQAPRALAQDTGQGEASSTTAPDIKPAPRPAVAQLLTATARPQTNLPPPRTTFVGRTTDVANLREVLDPSAPTSTRLLTLSGVAGCGKTRLALAVADGVRDAYEDGVWLVELAALPASPSADPAAVAAAALAALGLHEQSGQDLLEMLILHLQHRRLLLLLDNCEHLMPACAALTARLLGACQGLQIVVTSQHPLRMANETVWRVGTLAVPPAVDGMTMPEMLSLVGQSEAAQLFVERAQAAQPGFVLSAATAPNVAALCRRLDGLPLAIELAAARLHVLPLEDLLSRLDDRFRLLRRRGRDAADRHQTLQATMDWSYRLLEPAEQALLRRLAVFNGGWKLGAAEAVCADEEVAVETVLEVLDELLDRPLVYVHEAEGVPRYGLLETVRQYGLQRLEHAGETAALRERHLQWCVALAEQAAAALQGPEQGAWLARLEQEHDNLRSALHWAVDRGVGTLGLRLAGGLWIFWRSHGHRRDGRRWLAALLALAADEEDATDMAARATALQGAAWLAEDDHDFAQASALFTRSSALRRALGEDERLSGLLINAAMGARAGGDYVRATALLEQSLAQQHMQGSGGSPTQGGRALSLFRLALVLREQGDHARASALYEERLAKHRELGDREGIGHALQGLGDIARDQGDAPRVRALCEESLALFRELGQTWAIGFALNNLALAAYLEGDLALAGSRAEESAALFRDLEAGPSLAEVLITVGRVKDAQGATAAARANLVEALTLAWAKGPRLFVAASLEEFGTQAVRQGHAHYGVQLLGAAATLRQAMGAPVRPADQSALEGARAAARTSLGETSFAGAWATGQALPLEQVVLWQRGDVL